ncbi:MAG: TIGR03668 family PPOX class F420-dependent oxidoreductase, partial [Candidatus Binatia bacterium]
SGLELTMASPFSPEARALLERSRVARLATADASAEPHVIPFCYALDGDAIVFVVDEKPKAAGRTLKRLRNIAENPSVAIVVDRWDEDWSRLEYVLVHGEAAVVTDADAWARAVARLRERYPQYREMTLAPERNPVVRIEVRRAHHWRAAR